MIPEAASRPHVLAADLASPQGPMQLVSVSVLIATSIRRISLDRVMTMPVRISVARLNLSARPARRSGLDHADTSKAGPARRTAGRLHRRAATADRDALRRPNRHHSARTTQRGVPCRSARRPRRTIICSRRRGAPRHHGRLHNGRCLASCPCGSHHRPCVGYPVHSTAGTSR